MGKKKGGKFKADAVYSRKAQGTTLNNPFNPNKITSKKLNPFEVHVNKEKFQILGRICKHDKGLPGVSKAKAIKKRQETLGQAFKNKHKSNSFRDRRITNFLNDGDADDARFIAEKVGQFKQKRAARFNLNDDEILTHRGQTLEEIEQYRDERSDDDDDENENLNAEFTAATQFGGDEAEDNKDRKTAIDELILEQKKRKIEITREKVEVHNLTEKLDNNYKLLLNLMGKNQKNDAKAKPPPDDFDKIMREMIFEPRGVVSDKLQSEEVLAKKEKERLEKLENERLRRMNLDTAEQENESNKPKHRSADALDDDYFANDNQDDEEMLTYNIDGTLDNGIQQKIGKEKFSNSNNEEKQDDLSEEGSEDDEVEEEEEGDEDEDSNDEEDSDDNEEENSENEKEEGNDNDNSDSEDGESNESISIQKNSKQETKIIEENIEDLPFVFEMPTTYEEFIKLLENRTNETQKTIIERLIKCNHPKLDVVNREHIIRLFVFILQYLHSLFSNSNEADIEKNFELLDKLNPYIYDLMVLNSEKMSINLLNVIKEKCENYKEQTKLYPSLDTLIFFKLVSNYFSTSDYRHPVVTPSIVFIQLILSKARVRTRKDIAKGLFLITIILEYTQLSKRLLPEIFNFLQGILFLAIPKEDDQNILKTMPPFESCDKFNHLLVLAETFKSEDYSKEELLSSKDLILSAINDDFKLRSLNMSLKIIATSIKTIENRVGSQYIADNFLKLFKHLPIDLYPKFIQNNFEITKTILENVSKKSFTKLVPPASKPKALRLLEPLIETVYDDRRRPKLSESKEYTAKLQHKVKREMKGAIREIRRDTDFLQKMRLQQQIRSDIERKEKVKRIYQEASVQQGELNELTRKNRKGKF